MSYIAILKMLLKMSPTLIAVAAIVYIAYAFDKIGDLEQTNDELVTEMDTLAASMEYEREKFAVFTRRVNTLQNELNESERRQRDLYQLLQDHNLTNLAYSKPGLIESRINKGTEDVFENLERLTAPVNTDGM